MMLLGGFGVFHALKCNNPHAGHQLPAAHARSIARVLPRATQLKLTLPSLQKIALHQRLANERV